MMDRVFYTGNGTTPVDSGLPNVGRIFAIQPEGDLLWYRYLGHGEADRSGARGWQPHSANPIGRGWQNFLHVLGGGDGVVLAIQPDGDLLWYRYLGDGTADRTGALGWHPNSGNAIGRGWQHFRHVFVLPQEGRTTTPGITVFGVAENGDLRWYRYSGDGEKDPSGGLGWHPNSGNIVGNGWGGFQRIIGTGSAVFAVQPDGALLWYSYFGRGEPDHSGASGWLPNSGNQIGRGWQNFRHLTGGSNDSSGFGTVLYAVAGNGDLLWYRYDGHGEHDPTGATGWRPNSSNPIGNGW